MNGPTALSEPQQISYLNVSVAWKDTNFSRKKTRDPIHSNNKQFN